ncbi:MAG TPA: hypothetical protein VJ485_02010 [archaeon]|jgi:hypothetical protein|nr:hypothetical protein [archaeon]
MDIKISVSLAGVFRRIQLSVSEKGRPADCELSGIMKDPTGREEIFLPSPEKMLHNVSYPSSGGRFVTCTGKGTYQIIFQPKERGDHVLRILGRILEGRRNGERKRLQTVSSQNLPSSHFQPFEKAFHISF